MKSEPPLGIAILSILYWIRGILVILAGLPAVAAAGRQSRGDRELATT